MMYPQVLQTPRQAIQAFIFGTLRPKGFRYERKFTIVHPDFRTVESILKLHPAMFSEIYKPRHINSIYYDTPGLACYNDNLIGASERVKIRVRWYGDMLGAIDKPRLELKFKKANIGAKITFDLAPFTLAPGCSSAVMHEVFDQSNLPETVRERIRQVRPVQLIRYNRKYFRSADRRFRITLDQDVEYYKIKTLDNHFLERSIDRSQVVLELKYDVQDDDEAERIANSLPFRLTKNSKYASGIERLYR